MPLILVPNGPMPTTASFAPVTTGTAIKTMMQIKPSATQPIKLAGWGCSFDGFAAALPGKVELIETDVAATVTAYAAADLTKLDGEGLVLGDPTTNLIQVGASASGYTASAEGSITAIRNLDTPRFIAPTTQFDYQFPLGREPLIQVSKFARIRVLFGTAVNCYCYMLLIL